jgi:hypothetical protein
MPIHQNISEILLQLFVVFNFVSGDNGWQGTVALLAGCTLYSVESGRSL